MQINTKYHEKIKEKWVSLVFVGDKKLLNEEQYLYFFNFHKFSFHYSRMHTILQDKINVKLGKD